MRLNSFDARLKFDTPAYARPHRCSLFIAGTQPTQLIHVSQLISKFDFPFKLGISYHIMRQKPRDVI